MSSLEKKRSYEGSEKEIKRIREEIALHCRSKAFEVELSQFVNVFLAPKHQMCEHMECRWLRERHASVSSLCIANLSTWQLATICNYARDKVLVHDVSSLFRRPETLFYFFLHCFFGKYGGAAIYLLENGLKLDSFWSHLQDEHNSNSSTFTRGDTSQELSPYFEEPYFFTRITIARCINDHNEHFIALLEHNLPLNSVLADIVDTVVSRRKKTQHGVKVLHIIAMRRDNETKEASLEPLCKDQSSYFSCIPRDVVQYIIRPMVINSRGIALLIEQIKDDID